MDYILKAPRRFERIKQIDQLCLPTDESLSDKDVVTIDLSSVSFIKPLGVIGILLLVESIAKMQEAKSPSLKLIGPANSEVLDYLLKVDFVKALQSLCEWVIPEMEASHRKIRPVIPITRFHNFAEIENIADAMRIKFNTELAGLTTLLQPCHGIFSELAINAVEHAQSDGGFILAQQYNLTVGPILEIAVGDCGIGIAKSLEKSGVRFASDREAITRVLAGGVTCTNDPMRGYGLNYVRDELSRIVDRSLTLRSGDGYVILHADGRPYSAECLRFPGTLAHAVIPCG